MCTSACARQSPCRSLWSQWWSRSPTQFPCSLTPSSESHLSLALSHTHMHSFSLPLSLSRSPLSTLTITNTLFSADYQPVPIFVPIITNWGHRDFIWFLRSTAWSRGLVSLVFASEIHLRFYILVCGQDKTRVQSLLPRKTARHHPSLYIKEDY